jgi:molybdopterin converting factor small subunit
MTTNQVAMVTSRVRLRFFAAARQVVGVAEETMDGQDGLMGIVATLSARNESVAVVVSRCCFLVDGHHHKMDTQPLPPGSVVDVLPPFAGG